jgi:hypothetical protein
MFAIFNYAIVGYSWLFLREVRAIIISNCTRSDIFWFQTTGRSLEEMQNIFGGQKGSDAKNVEAGIEDYHEDIPGVPLESK